jgi:acetoacetyl-CoA reductase/3-oxoacyl-[acyl-carrier protein] reductase
MGDSMAAGTATRERTPPGLLTDDALIPHERSLQDHVALVTGGTRGIGAAISQALASRGATIAAGYGTAHERAQQFAAQLRITEPDIPLSLHSGNLGDPSDCRRVVDEVLQRWGRLDILVNNAGITADRTVPKMTHDDWYRVLDVNLSGAFFLSQAALAHMLERGSGRIIMVSSVIGEMGNVGQANYAASKSGLFGLTKTMAREAVFHLARDGRLGTHPVGLTVNAVSPGYIETEMTGAVPEKVLDRIRSTIPLARLGGVEEVARVVYFLADDASSYITGQVWGVNGGLDM